MTIQFEKFETVVGFECHVQLNTKSKLFSAGENAFGATPNSLLDIVDAGLPGVLPTLNRSAVEGAVRLGLALGCEIRNESIFSRKHYFYPDLPKGYQISQFDKPICEHGQLRFILDGVEKNIRIRRIHIEEDAGKNTHTDGLNTSFVDFNRAGTPLLEVVSEPDLRSAEECMAALKALRQIVTFLNICDGNMQEGSLRADINVSVMKKDSTELGTRTETKNLNSFRYIGQAIVFEARRQILALSSGQAIRLETRLWDPNAKESRSMRSKEEAHDYRYFPDPDLLPLRLSASLLSELKSTIPEMAHEKLARYQNSLGLSSYDAQILTSDRHIADYFEATLKNHPNPKLIANWIINEVIKGNHEDDEFQPPIPARALAELVQLIDSKSISNAIAKQVFALLAKNPELKAQQVVIDNKWQVVSDQSHIESLVEKIISNNSEEVAKYLGGKTKVFGFLMGQLMRLSQGKIEPETAHRLMLEGLERIKSRAPDSQ